MLNPFINTNLYNNLCIEHLINDDTYDKIVPNEGIVFVYGGNTYKLTGAFAPLNQIIFKTCYT